MTIEQDRVKLALSFREDWRACKRCPLHNGNVPVPWNGDMSPTFALMGEAPGAEEAEQGIPFVGRAGKKLRLYLRQVGIDDTSVTMFNSVACRPPGNRDPDGDELAACKPWVSGTLEFIKPRVLVTVGRVAYHQILGRKKPMLINMHGKPLYEPRSRAVWVPTYHPSAALRPGGKKYEQMILDDLEQAARWAKDDIPPPALDECYICGDELSRFDEFGIGYCARHCIIQGGLFD